MKLDETKDKLVRILINVYFQFLALYELYPEQVGINLQAINEIVIRYLKDRHRINIYHNIKHDIDRHKSSGYLTYWICKIKPLEILDLTLFTNKEKARFYSLINEYYSLILVGGNLIAKSNNDIIDINEKKDFADAITYSLKYRPINADALSIIFYLLEEAS